jgi:hypothetical protein
MREFESSKTMFNGDLIMDTTRQTYKNELVKLIEKHNDKSWNWISYEFKKDFSRFDKLHFFSIKNMSVVQSNTGCIHLDNTTERFNHIKNMRIFSDVFLEVEDKITNPIFFWTLQFIYYPESNLCHSNFEKWNLAFSRYDRLTLSFNERQKCVDQNIKELQNLNPIAINKTMFNYFKKNDNWNIFRGFSVRKNDDIRVGRKVVGNPQSETQENGRGLSYTIRKQTAVFFSRQYQVMSSKNGTELSNGEGVLDQTSVPINYFDGVDEELLNSDAKRVVAMYTISKKDVLYYNNLFGESELVALPSSVKLKRYWFTTVEEFEKVIDGNITTNKNAWSTLQ